MNTEKSLGKQLLAVTVVRFCLSCLFELLERTHRTLLFFNFMLDFFIMAFVLNLTNKDPQQCSRSICTGVGTFCGKVSGNLVSKGNKFSYQCLLQLIN